MLMIAVLALSVSADRKLDYLVKKNKYQKAIQYIEKKYPSESRTIEMWSLLGEMSEGTGLSEKAMGCYLAIIRTEPRNEMALSSLVRLYMRMKMYPNAYTMVKSLLQSKSNDAGIIWNAAKICISLNKIEEAKEHLIKIYKFNTGAQKALGDIYFKENKYEDAMPLYKSYFSASKDLEVANKIVGYYKSKDSLDDVSEYFKYVADNDKKDTIAKLYMARYLISKSENSSAMKYYSLIPESVYDPVDYFNIGNYKKAEGKLNDAIQFFSAVSEKSKNGSDIYRKSELELGLIYLELKNYRKSIEHLTPVKDMIPDYDLYMARAYDALKDYKKSEKFSSDYLKKNPKNIQASMIYAMALEKKGYVTQANELREKCIKLDYYNSNIQYEMASYYFENGQYSSAIKHFEKSYLLDQNIMCMEKIAFCAYNIDQLDKARDASEVVIENNPDNKTALDVLYKIYIKRDKHKLAIPYLEKLTKLEPMNMKYLLQLSGCYEKINDYNNVIAVDEKIIELNPDNDKSKRRLAEDRFNTGRYEDALNMYSYLIKSGKIKDLDYPKVIESALKLKLKNRAIEYLEQYSALKPNEYNTYKDLGRLYFELENYDASLTNYRKALSINNKITGIYNHYAKLVVIKKWDDKSIIYVSEMAISLKEADIDIYENLGDAYVRTGDNKKALDNYQKATSLNPKDVKVFSKYAKSQISNGLIKEAIVSYEQLVIIDTLKENFKTLGDLYKEKNNSKEAVTNYKKYLSNINNDDLATYVAMYEHDAGNHWEALKYFDKMSQFSRGTIYARGESYFVCKKYDNAISILGSYLKKYPNDKNFYEVNKMIGISYDGLNKSTAITYYKVYLSKRDDNDIAFRVGELQEKVNLNTAYETYEANSFKYLNDYRNFVKLGDLTKDNKNKSAFYYEKAVELNDTLLSVLLKLGALYNDLKMEDSKITAYKKAVALDPQNFEANKYLGITLYNRNQSKEGLLYLELARSQKADDPEIMYTLGKSYVHDGKLTEAILLFQTSKKLQPNNCDVRYTLTNTLKSQKQYSEALKESDELLRMKETKEYLDLYISILFEMGKYSMIETAVKMRRKNNPEDVSLLMTMAKAQYLDKRFDDALQSYVMISFIREGYEPALLGRAYVYTQMGKLDNAKTYYEKVLKLNPKSVTAYIGLARLYKGIGDQNSYMENLRKAREISPNDSLVLKEMETISN